MRSASSAEPGWSSLAMGDEAVDISSTPRVWKLSEQGYHGVHQLPAFRVIDHLAAAVRMINPSFGRRQPMSNKKSNSINKEYLRNLDTAEHIERSGAMPAAGNTLPEESFGARLRRYRERAGLSRPVLGGLCGKSADWVKALETGKIMTPRLPVLIRLAEVLHVDDLADLTGEERVSAVSYTKSSHEQLTTVTEALTRYPIGMADRDPVNPENLAARVKQAWQLWHGAGRHRTAVSTLLPSLLNDARFSVQRLTGAERRSALRSLAQIYHLTQLYLSFQPVPELVIMAGDRAMNAAQDADDPVAIAAATWYINHIWREAGQQHEARISLALDVIRLLRPEADREQRALWGLMHLAIALSHARTGREGDAWRHWDQADAAARALDGWIHPWLLFGRGMVDAYAVTLLNDLMRGGKATRRAATLDLESVMPSATRRAFHMIETARAYSQRREPVAVVHLLRRAWQESPETTQFNLFTRAVLLDLAERGDLMIRREARDLAQTIGVLTE